MKKLLILGLASSLLLAESRIDERYKEKYLKDIPNIRSQISVEDLHKNTKDLNLSQVGKDIEAIKTEVNSTINFQPKDPNAEKAAKEISDFRRSKAFGEEIKKAESYILDDKGFDFGKYAYSPQTMQMIKDMDKNKHLISKNEYLDANERIFIIISSSMSDETIKNYFSALENVSSDISFILRGVVSNDIRHFKPTQEFITKTLLKNSKADISKDAEIYNAQIEINPKITRRFRIERVPAVLFITNYNSAVQDFQNFIGSPDENEKYYIAYGEAEVAYALREINKQAKSAGLDRLIKAMNKSFYQQGGNNEKE